jgi:transposase
MGKPYSQDLRERVIAAVDTGTGAYVAALLFRVSVSYIYKALIRRRKARRSKLRHRVVTEFPLARADMVKAVSTDADGK